ncbi:hypothetical protein [Caloranaerobacter azorensis]|uniref:Uncharacterized protein n=1 Tax=Caloranaerobacter azorensis TaxID=116090 RepID=A0A6P1YGV1_9FIRM|nr:hypothetical protein [Caloranaerobacter azorensis]QIB27938.1 hypothetical protein G3A45_12055 [Caloranaerobacter azorensis]
MGIIRRDAIKKISKNKEAKIAYFKNELFLCRKKIKELKSISVDNLSDFKKIQLERDLQIEMHKREVLKKRLLGLGISEKRGRPKKNDSEKYSTTHKKFTAMLKPENLEYLKKLKSDKKIKNISCFLDELIEKYRFDNE